MVWDLHFPLTSKPKLLQRLQIGPLGVMGLHPQAPALQTGEQLFTTHGHIYRGSCSEACFLPTVIEPILRTVEVVNALLKLVMELLVVGRALSSSTDISSIIRRVATGKNKQQSVIFKYKVI